MHAMTAPATELTDVTLYGCLADAGGRVIRLTLPAAGISEPALRELVAAACPAIAELALSARVRLCVDDVILTGAATIAATARIALFPPVSGG